MRKETKIISFLFLPFFLLFSMSFFDSNNKSVFDFVSYFFPLVIQPSLWFLEIALFYFLFWFSKKTLLIFQGKINSHAHILDVIKKRKYVITESLFALILSFSATTYLVPILSFLVTKFNIPTKDEALLSLDLLLTKTIPFLTIHKVGIPIILENLIIVSYQNLSLFILLFVFIFLIKDIDVFFRFLTTLSITLVLLFFIWIFIPAYTPQYRYIENPKNIPSPQHIQKKLDEFKPSKPVQSFLNTMRPAISRTKEFPLSTFPSTHIAITTILGWFLYFFSRKIFYITTPILFASSIGTVYLAQHYFIDIPAGFFIALFGIYLTKKFLKY